MSDGRRWSDGDRLITDEELSVILWCGYKKGEDTGRNLARPFEDWVRERYDGDSFLLLARCAVYHAAGKDPCEHVFHEFMRDMMAVRPGDVERQTGWRMKG